MNKNRKEKILADKGKHLEKVVDRPTNYKLVQRLKGKSRKTMCNTTIHQGIHTHTYTHK